MTAESLAHGLGLKRQGRTWRGPCPVHGGSSFTVSEKDGNVLFYCWSGCDRGDILSDLRRRGLWPEVERPEWTREQKRAWGRRRALAERQAAELEGWLEDKLSLLRRIRNLFWDRAKLAESWMRGDGLTVEMDHPHMVEAIKATTTDARLGDRINEAVEQLLSMEPGAVRGLRDRTAERRAA